LACGCGNCEIDNEFEIISHSLTNTKKKNPIPNKLKNGSKNDPGAKKLRTN
jgi:hypothetical protein